MVDLPEPMLPSMVIIVSTHMMLRQTPKYMMLDEAHRGAGINQGARNFVE
jgi:hypothetical protein